MLFLDLETSCTNQALSTVLGFVGRTLTLIEIIVPIILIATLSIKIAKKVRNPDDNKIFPQIKNSLIATAIVFLIPTITNAVFNMYGETTNVSSCWLLAKNNGYTINSPQYIQIESEQRQKIYVDPNEYQKGVPKPETATYVNGGITPASGNRLVEVARSQIGVPYHTMHYGPKGSGNEGFGCAMFVSYCYNQVFFGGVSGQSMGLGGFYGSTYEFWGNVTKDGYNAHNKRFVEVSPSQAQAGDVIAFLRGNDHYSSHSNCYHVGLYIGNGKMIDSSGSGTSGRGVAEGSIDINRSDIHFLRYVGN